MKSGSKMIVLGAGIVGLFTALLLRQRGVDVTVFDPATQAARQSSWAGGGIVCPLWPWDEPPEVQRWAQQARGLYPDWAVRLLADTGVDIEYRQTGIQWSLSTEERVAALAWHRQWQLPCVETADGVLSPALGQVRNPRLGRALADAAVRAGVTLRLGETATPLRSGDRVVGVKAADGAVLKADAVIVAAGAWSAQVLSAVGIASDIHPVKGQMLLFAPRGDAVPVGPVRISRSVYLIPRADGQVLVGSTSEWVGFDTVVTDDARRKLQDAALALWPDLAAYQQVGQWAGLRPASSGLPQVGPAALPGLWVNTGHFRNGITLAPATALDVVGQLLASVDEAEAYRLG